MRKFMTLATGVLATSALAISPALAHHSGYEESTGDQYQTCADQTGADPAGVVICSGSSSEDSGFIALGLGEGRDGGSGGLGVIAVSGDASDGHGHVYAEDWTEGDQIANAVQAAQGEDPAANDSDTAIIHIHPGS